jgi:ATP-binding cassette subfamily B protein
MNRICEVLDEGKQDRSETATEGAMALPENPDRYISFENVTFSYRGKTDNTKNVSFHLPRGGTLGIIGATGSGKTTLLSLLMRFYQVPVDGGTIRIGGRDIRTMTPEELRSRFGVAMQNDFLYAGSIEDNIRFGRDMTHEQVVHAATMAQAHEFISKLADGYDHKLTVKGTNLSGGQKQRLLIARALAGEPDILVLDDASSALDYKTDAALRKALREDAESRTAAAVTTSGVTTTVIVAQRVSSIKDADLILVMDRGGVIGCGTHDELVASCPIYNEIAESQMGGAILE